MRLGGLILACDLAFDRELVGSAVDDFADQDEVGVAQRSVGNDQPAVMARSRAGVRVLAQVPRNLAGIGAGSGAPAARH